MSEPYNPSALLKPGFLNAAVDWDDANELVEQMMVETDPEKLAGLIEHAVDKTDRAHCVIFHLMTRARSGHKSKSLIEEGIHP